MSGDKPLTYDVPQAATRLGGPFTVDWLRGHLDEIPHLRVGSGRGRGGRIGFTDAQLDAIVDQHTVAPKTSPALVAGDFTPITRRKRGFAVPG